MDADHSDFEFPTTTTSSCAVQNDIVFCGKLMVTAETNSNSNPNPFLLTSNSSRKLNNSRPERWRRSSSCRNNYKERHGLFGIPRFPIEMDMSEMKMRQGRREPAPLPKLPENGGADECGKSCWEMVRPLRRKGSLMSVLAKASFGCIPSL